MNDCICNKCNGKLAILGDDMKIPQYCHTCFLNDVHIDKLTQKIILKHDCLNCNMPIPAMSQYEMIHKKHAHLHICPHNFPDIPYVELNINQ